MTIPGIDGRKMSKSYGNQIPLSATPDEIRRLVSRIVTRTRAPAEPKEPATVLALYRQVADAGAAADLARRYRDGTVGYAKAKALLADAIERLVASGRDRHAALLADPAGLRATLAASAVRARESAAATLAAVRAAVGMGWG